LHAANNNNDNRNDTNGKDSHHIKSLDTQHQTNAHKNQTKPNTLIVNIEQYLISHIKKTNCDPQLLFHHTHI